MGRVVGLWRYPVKSFGGEPRDELVVDERGIAGDRIWALVHANGKIASGKTTRRFARVPGLLRHRARLGDDGAPLLELADGRTTPAGAAIAAELAGDGWRFDRERTTSHFDAGPVHVVTTATLAALAAVSETPVEVERLRPNLLVESDEREEGWLGRRLVAGGVELEVTVPAPRCVMVCHEQPGLPTRPALLREIARGHGLDVGVYACVVRPGRVRRGDAVGVG